MLVTRVGQWRLSSSLGGGGNGNVYRAEGDDGREAAVKVLRAFGRDRVERFRTEIATLTELNGHPGVLPIFESGFPDSPSIKDPPWFAMPVAVKMKKALGRDATIDVVIGAMGEIASTLADLAGRGIFHRDIKPDNLFHYEHRWVVGDLGLVTTPDSPQVTKAGRVLGSHFYVAPEMVLDPKHSDGGPADVYELAKTLWVLLTGRTDPPPGHHRIEEQSLQLTPYVHDQDVVPLEFLIERATHPDPSKRPTMNEIAEELHAWSDLQSREKAPLDVSQVAKDLRLALEPARRANETTQSRERIVHGIWMRLIHDLEQIAEELAEENLDVRVERNSAGFARRFAEHRLNGREILTMAGSHVAVGASIDRPSSQGGPVAFYLFCNVAVIRLGTGEVVIGGGNTLGPSPDVPSDGCEPVWLMAEPGSVAERVDEAKVIDQLRTTLPDAMTRLGDWLKRFGLAP